MMSFFFYVPFEKVNFLHFRFLHSFVFDKIINSHLFFGTNDSRVMLMMLSPLLMLVRTFWVTFFLSSFSFFLFFLFHVLMLFWHYTENYLNEIHLFIKNLELQNNKKKKKCAINRRQIQSLFSLNDVY